MNYRICYTGKSYRLNIVEETMCHEEDLANTIRGLQGLGYSIFAVFSTKEEF